MPQIQVSQGTIEYREEGSGPPAVLIHGLLVNGRVWERVVPPLSEHMRCIVPELPLGSHPAPMSPDADMSPLGLASLIAEVLERLELSEVTLVANDTGGALAQLVCVHHPERIGRLVLTNCDAFENFPPRAFKPLATVLGRVPGAVAALELMGRSRRMRKATMSLAPLTVEPVPDDLLKAWMAPLRDRRIRRDLVKVLRGIDPRYTLEAARALHGFERPALIVWGLRDPFFKLAEGRRLAEVFPDARLETVEDSRTFVQFDAPERLAELTTEFASVPAT